MTDPIVKIRHILVLFLWLPLSVSAQLLSPSSKISMLTGTPGQELYSTFGHNAIRVHDPALDMDWVFNYGTFDFDTPNFYMKFMRGKLDYMLSIAEFDRFKLGYHYGKQAVTEQVINLDSAEKQQVFNFLMNNYRTENRYYKYDFFYDNCATRIRDLFMEIAGDSLDFNYPPQWTSNPLTFRQLLDYYLAPKPWNDLGIDIALGLPTDRLANPGQYMFLPEFMMEAFAHATIRKNGKWKPLVSYSAVIIDNDPDEPAAFELTPQLTNWTLFVVILMISFYELKRKKIYKGIDYVFFNILGLLGWLIVFLWFFTDHIATKDNLNIFWALPTHLPLIFLVLQKKRRLFSKVYLALVMLLASLLLVFWPLIPQLLHLSIIPILLVIMLRCGLHLRLLLVFQHNN